MAAAHASGADGVLVIVRALGDAGCATSRRPRFDLGLDPVHECFDEIDVIERSLRVGATIIGVNTGT